MAAALLLLLLFLIAPLLSPAASQSAPAPSSPGPINITGILDHAGGYSFFIRLLNKTQVGDQIDNQLNNSYDGMTVFAPTDNAFNNLPGGTINNLSDQQQVQFVLYHVLPKFYLLGTLQTASNPVRTQATGQDGVPFTLNITTHDSRVNISTGIVNNVPVNNAIRQVSPLAVYGIEQVLLPKEFYEPGPPAPAPAPPANGTATHGGGRVNGVAPSTGNPSGNGCGKSMGVGMGLLGGFWLSCMALF